MTGGNFHKSESRDEGQGWLEESLSTTQDICLGLKGLNEGKQKRQRQKKQVRLHRENDKGTQWYLQICNKQKFKLATRN